LNLLPCEYNVLPYAYSFVGYKHTESTKLRMSLSRKYFKHTEESKLKMSINRGTSIYVYNTNKLLMNILPSLNKASKYFLCLDITIMRYARNEKIFKEK
jgi:NUMOD3 motif